MYFIQMLWPKCHVAIYDFKSKKIESRIDVCPNSLSLSLSPNEQWLTYFRGGKPALLKDEEMKPSQLLIKNILNGDEKIIAKDASPFGLPAIWLADDELIYKNISDGTVLININTQKKQIWNLKKGISPNALSPDGKHLLCDDYLAGGKNVYLLDLKDQSLKPVMHSWFFLIQSADFLSPDGKSFIYTRQSWEDLIPLHEVGNIYWRDLSTGKEQKLSDNVALFGGFWLAEDPMNKPEFENKK
ncbi:MAG: hypothetical protein HYZ83_03510 [Candidatus Omnitrophica bacterium]|nr:hypothetical protein [Candidatus Omnitrophota bacterium]